MASLSTAFGLCSVTDSKSLLGVSGDEEGCAIVTLGKSMVIRCRLSDQKQVNSWSTALAKLTSKVVWNPKEESFVGVFNNVYIKQWTKEDSSLEKTKKHKFKNEIHDILIFCKDGILKKPQLVVVFKNGSVRDLESALSNLKEEMKGILQPLEVIELADIIRHGDNRYLIAVAKFENKYRQCYCVLLQEESFLVTDSVRKIKLRRQGSSLLGFTILSGEKGNSLLTLWSDGFLYSLPLPLESENPGIGNYLGAINFISKKSEVSLQAVGKDRVAIYGADPSEEGACLGIYNVKFGVIQAQTSFKMFNKPPRMWLVENSLVTVMGQRLVCVPFNLQTETLSALVGSRALHADLKTPSEICTLIPTAVWDDVGDSSDKRPAVEYPENIRQQLETFSSEGWSEFGICQALMNHLIETRDIGSLSWCLKNFADIPEKYLVRMIQMALAKDSEEAFESATETNLAEVGTKFEFVNKILTTPVDRMSLMKHLRELFGLEDCLCLIGYLVGLFSEEGSHGDVAAEECPNVLDWTMALLDAFYQQLVLSRDAKVFDLTVQLKQRIEENILCVNDLKKLLPSVIRLKSGKAIDKKTGHRKSYYLERFRLYDLLGQVSFNFCRRAFESHFEVDRRSRVGQYLMPSDRLGQTQDVSHKSQAWTSLPMTGQ